MAGAHLGGPVELRSPAHVRRDSVACQPGEDGEEADHDDHADSGRPAVDGGERDAGDHGHEVVHHQHEAVVETLQSAGCGLGLWS